MLRDHIGFTLFMSLLLIAPKIPLKGHGGVERSSMSLGLAGLIIWFFAHPKKLFLFPRMGASHPLLLLVIFAIYAFVISLLSASIVSIAYAVQFLAYAVIGTILMRRYARSYIRADNRRAGLIFFGIAVIYAIGIIISLFTGPIYRFQTFWTVRSWGGFRIQQGVGFSEGQNMAGAVVAFFIAACIYLYRGKNWKRWILLCLLLFVLLTTLSRSAIISFVLALTIVLCLSNLRPFVQRGSIKVSVVKDAGFVASALGLLIIIIVLGIYLINKSFLPAVLSGLGLSSEHDLFVSSLVDRFHLWRWGLSSWASQNLLKMIFGGGFRSSMTISSYGTWHTAHNVYITILGDFGVVGLSIFLAALLGALWRYTRLFLTDKAGRFEKFGLMAVLALSIQNMTGEFFYSPVCLSLLIFTYAATIVKDNSECLTTL